MSIRHAVPADVDTLADIEAASYPPAEGASRQSIAGRVAVYPDHFWLLEDGDTLVSFVNGLVTNERDLTDEMYENAAMHDENGAWQMIFGVVTHPDYQRRGCAEKLLRYVVEQARTQGRRGLVLTCKERLVHFYAKIGFVDEGISESTHGGVVWYQMRLTF